MSKPEYIKVNFNISKVLKKQAEILSLKLYGPKKTGTLYRFAIAKFINENNKKDSK
jgi:hypothetical protein